MFSAVIFDFDGIIVDTEPAHYEAFQKVLAPLGLGFPWQDYLDGFLGLDDRDAFRKVFRIEGRPLYDAELDDLIRLKGLAFTDMVSAGVTPYPGVVELIRALSVRLPVALCSGARRSDVVPVLALLGLAGSFDAMVTADEVAASKPDPESYRTAVARLRKIFPAVDASTTLAIEDTPAGIASATGAGVKVLAVTNSYPRERLVEATWIVDSLCSVDLSSSSDAPPACA
ncbi:phosphatase/phosphohexomutase-related hydrolase [Citrifermentans bemidjiense Bem]|uniref:Phosphatase/phosphohexomutase-related hydrolase n=1 Tax=Citrifermentans bemidjiense (strain ATCC BAA-1014 / DSM 16622 / JCM 12645 / Bem) TaxID=404380 RepID=B5EB24_CITBB|nr:HAD family phosphatase [Citrifermentans bemidjiense]ACH38885.1 phosphatase/phosphohexomutase-related hydrolase [Citrifermentans bemidjiense Bem]